MDRSEIRDITQREALIIELVHHLSAGTREEMGYSLSEIIQLLTTPIKRKQDRTALECLHDEGHEFIAELIEYLKQ